MDSKPIELGRITAENLRSELDADGKPVMKLDVIVRPPAEGVCLGGIEYEAGSRPIPPQPRFES